VEPTRGHRLDHHDDERAVVRDVLLRSKGHDHQADDEDDEGG
jgi:hypothetical protein